MTTQIHTHNFYAMGCHMAVWLEHEDTQTAVSTENNTDNGRYRDIQFDKSSRSIKLPKGVRLDLGDIGKGYTAQQAVGYLDMLGPCLIDAGGDLTAGFAPESYPGWPVGIASPYSSAEGERENLLRLWLAESAKLTARGLMKERPLRCNGRLRRGNGRSNQPLLMVQ